MQRLRLRYAKRGAARFTSHRDFTRAFERALRRAEVPMAYSSGFSPHPRISYANASPTSAATEAEYLEIGLSEVCDPAKVMATLNEVLPPGMQMLEVVEDQTASIADALPASAWIVDLGDPEAGEVDQSALEKAVGQLLGSQSWEVQRMTKSGLRTFDVRHAVVLLQVSGPGQLRLVSLQGTPLVRPDDVVSALRAAEPALASTRPAMLTRLLQGRVVDGDEGTAATGVLLDPFSQEPTAPW